jgi:hypothetical protein
MSIQPKEGSNNLCEMAHLSNTEAKRIVRRIDAHLINRTSALLGFCLWI